MTSDTRTSDVWTCCYCGERFTRGATITRDGLCHLRCAEQRDEDDSRRPPLLSRGTLPSPDPAEDPVRGILAAYRPFEPSACGECARFVCICDGSLHIHEHVIEGLSMAARDLASQLASEQSARADSDEALRITRKSLAASDARAVAADRLARSECEQRDQWRAAHKRACDARDEAEARATCIAAELAAARAWFDSLRAYAVVMPAETARAFEMSLERAMSGRDAALAGPELRVGEVGG